MAKYITEQKKTLERLLRDNCESAYTVDELCQKMVSLYGDSAPGKSTVYRLITALVEDGRVKRFTSENQRRASYQIIIGEHCNHHLHLKCTSCGKILHLDEHISENLVLSVMAASGFTVSEPSTMLFGKCSDCDSKN